MNITITGYEAICNSGIGINLIYEKAINGDAAYFECTKDYVKNHSVRIGVIKEKNLPEIDEEHFNLRCNRLILKTLELLKPKLEKFLHRYPKEKIGIVVATTNSGVEEFENSNNPKHFELSNPALFLKQHLDLKGTHTSVSTACSSGTLAFLTARNYLQNNIMEGVIVVCVDSITKLPLYGFTSLEALSETTSTPFSKNRSGMNIGEGCAIFLLEKGNKEGIKILSIKSTSDTYHPTTPDPKGKEVIRAIKEALYEANITPDKIDYINAHGTGTLSNDIMEANAIYEVFQNTAPTSSTKPLTGHCLGASAGIEIALCAKLIENFDGRLYPHTLKGEYDTNLPKINLVEKNKKYPKCKICMSNSFGFGGSNAIIILGENG